MKALALLVVVCGLAAAGDGTSQPQDARPAGSVRPRVVSITAKKFQFEPEEIHLKKGEPVILLIKSADVTHGFKIADLKLRVDVTTGAVTAVPFTPLNEGTFSFECDVFCGLHHEDMNGTLIVDK